MNFHQLVTKAVADLGGLVDPHARVLHQLTMKRGGRRILIGHFATKSRAEETADQLRQYDPSWKPDIRRVTDTGKIPVSESRLHDNPNIRWVNGPPRFKNGEPIAAAVTAAQMKDGRVVADPRARIHADLDIDWADAESGGFLGVRP